LHFGISFAVFEVRNNIMKIKSKFINNKPGERFRNSSLPYGTVFAAPGGFLLKIYVNTVKTGKERAKHK